MTQTGIIPAWTLGDRLRKARGTTGLTTREFGKRVGLSQATVTNAENDRHKVRRITIIAWAMATGVDPRWLAEGEQTPPGGSSEWALWDSNPQPTDYVCALVREGLRVVDGRAAA